MQIAQAVYAEASVVRFGYVLYLVYGELHSGALAFGVGVCLAFKSRATAFAMDDFVLLIGNRHGAKIKSPEVTYFRA
ncbi:hypothetical protein GCM10011425_02960 [Mucilaginibacter galii]|uniref:Uncharacterized protein n=1 Tax=Mucilaginibacter galii TaxID=2005073 RepID=A0A917N062_9SPHI|nr:hypothetical protein GCM10011425_02960 [Mucilaginibacter galii]